MMAVSTPMMDKIIPTTATRLFSDRLPNKPNTTPVIPNAVPAIGISPAHKLKTPKPAESKA